MYSRRREVLKDERETFSLKPGYFLLAELTGDRFPLRVNTGRVDGRAFPLAELTGLNVKHDVTTAVSLFSS